MELSKLDEVTELESAACPIDDPNSGEYLFSIIIAGPMHESTRKHAESEGRSLAHQSKRLGGMQKAMDARAETILTDTDVAVAKHVKTLMARSLGWLDLTEGGKPKEYDPKVLQELYEKHAWIRDAVFAFMGEARNFLAKKSTGSSPTPSSSSS